MPTGTPAGVLASITLTVNETLLNEGGIGADMVAGLTSDRPLLV